MDESTTEVESAPQDVEQAPSTRAPIDTTEMPLNIPFLQSLLEKFPEKPTVDHVKEFVAQYNIEELKEARFWVIAVLGKPQERTAKRRPTPWKKWLMSVPNRAENVCTSCHSIDNGEKVAAEPEVISDEGSATDASSARPIRSKKRSATSLHPYSCPNCTTRNCTSYEELMQKLETCLSPSAHANEICKKNPNGPTIFERCVELPYIEVENRVEARIRALHRVAAEFVLDRPVHSSVGMMGTYLFCISVPFKSGSTLTILTQIHFLPVIRDQLRATSLSFLALLLTPRYVPFQVE